MQRRWSYRYSSSEMMFLEIIGSELVCYLNQQGPHDEHWPFAEVLAGEHDVELRLQLGDGAPEEIKAAIRSEMNEPKLSPAEAKRLDMLRRRGESKQRSGPPEHLPPPVPGAGPMPDTRAGDW